MKLRQLKGKTLPNYDMSSVFIELYHIEEIIKDGKHVEQKNYIITRLVTIIEQFFRKVLEFLFRRHPETRPQNITLDTRIINDIIKADFNRRWWHATELIISHTFSFQNTKDIADAMNTYGGIQIFSNGSTKSNHDAETGLIRRDYDRLFEARHAIVHSIEWRPHLDVRRYYDMAEKLMNHTLEKVEYYRFHDEHDQALLQLQSSEADKYHGIAKKLYDDVLRERKTASELFSQGKYEESIDHYDKVLFLEPDDFTAHFSKGSSFYLLEKYREAIGCFERHLELVNDPGAYFWMGMALQKLGEHEDAIKWFEKVIEHSLDDSTAYIKLAISLGNLGLLDDALKYTNMVLDTEPENNSALEIQKITLEEINRLNNRSPDAT